ncbi:MAG: DUF935 family protein [Verrucomicrobiota bacterium]
MADKIKKNSESKVDISRVRYELQARFNPLKGFTPQKAVRLLEEFDRGILRECAWAMEKIENTDDTIKSVSSKRKKAPSRQPYSIAPYESWEDHGTEAQLQEQTKFLENLFNSLTCTHALERNTRGGVRLAIHQMCDAIGKRYAVHELDWRPQRDGSLELGMTFVPLWFFESTTGLLRFLPRGNNQQGDELEPLGWMVTMGDGLMVATMVNYIYKALPLKDWLTYSERCGMPFVTSATDAKYRSQEWDEGLEALRAIGAEFAAQHSRHAEFKVHDLTAKGQLPYPGMVERAERGIAIIWRGSDLSTMSGEDKMGASLQQDESDILLEDDVDMINETFEHQIVLPALRWKFGRDVKPLCYFKLQAPDRLDEKAEQEKMHKAADYGAEIPMSDYKERLSLPVTADEPQDAILTPAANRAEPAAPSRELDDQANATEEELRQLAGTMAEDFEDVLELLQAVEEADTPDEYVAALQALSSALKDRGIDPSQSAFAQLLEKALGTSAAEGAAAVQIQFDDNNE